MGDRQEDINRVAMVWDAYLRHHPRAMLAPERRKLIEARLSEGWPVETLIAAIDGNHADPHCNGENDRRKQYHGIALILRDADHIERYAELAESERTDDPMEAAWQTYLRWVVEAESSEVAGNEVEATLERMAGTFPDAIMDEIVRRVEGEPA